MRHRQIAGARRRVWWLPVKGFTFLAKVIAITLGTSSGSRRLALRITGKAAVVAPFKRQAIVDSGTMRSGGCGLGNHQ